MGHYYHKLDDGVVAPRHFVEMSSKPGELRPTRITDVRKMWKAGEVVVPSVTTVLNVLAKPALTNWLIDQHLQQAWNLAREGKLLESYPDFLGEVKYQTEMETDKAPTAGTDFHKAMELYIKSELPESNEFYDLCHNVHIEVLCHNDGFTGEYLIEYNFISDDGYGGQIDLVTPAPMLIDYKTKQTADKFKPGKMVYDEHKMQLAAYRKGIGAPGARTANLFVCLENGEIDFHEHQEAELQKGWELFQSALSIWKLQNDYPERAVAGDY